MQRATRNLKGGKRVNSTGYHLGKKANSVFDSHSTSAVQLSTHMLIEGLGTKIVPQHSASTRGWNWNPNSPAGNPCPNRDSVVLKIPQEPHPEPGGTTMPSLSLLAVALLWTKAGKINTTGAGLGALDPGRIEASVCCPDPGYLTIHLFFAFLIII